MDGEAQRAARQRRIQEHRERLLAQLRERRGEFAGSYRLPLEYPASVDGGVDGGDGDGPTPTRPRTSAEFVNARLLEAGLPLGSAVASTLGEHGAAAGRFIRDLEGTGCYNSVRVNVGPPRSAEEGEDGQQDEALPHRVTVSLDEKKWYSLHVGGGVNSDDLTSQAGGGGGGMGSVMSSASSLPKLQFETSAGLLNLTGHCDRTSASWAVDQTGRGVFRFAHDRPLASLLDKRGGMYGWLMPGDPASAEEGFAEDQTGHAVDDAWYALGGGSQTSVGLHASAHGTEASHSRSSSGYVRSVGLRVANHPRSASRSLSSPGPARPSSSCPEAMAGPYLYAEAGASLRDSVPDRDADAPFALDCSPEVAADAGTTLKTSVRGGLHLNGSLVDDRYDPTAGVDGYLDGEVALPPGDVGFVKVRAGVATHVPLELFGGMLGLAGPASDGDSQPAEPQTVEGPAVHGSLSCGILRPLDYGGLCNAGRPGSVPLSDMFYAGGPGQLRGFLPSGVGPRSSRGGRRTPGGDALGGDLFYAATVAASAPLPEALGALRSGGGRAFGFVNGGTCVSTAGGGEGGAASLLSPQLWGWVMNSTRLSVGCGLSFGTPLGRFEATYAVPVRYGPRDARKAVQLGFGFSFG